jgi:hypothetical protein
MTDHIDLEEEPYWPEERSDPAQVRARQALIDLFGRRREEVFYSRQLEVMLEGEFFHWITSRALRELIAEGLIRTEERELSTGTRIRIVWHRTYRYYRRAATRLIELVEAYSDPNIGGALGLHGEMLVLEGFARERFIMAGRDIREYGGATWEETEHDLDFVFEGEGQAYGVEVKNTLGYMERDELWIKVRLCRTIGVTPVFVVRMLPRTWIAQVDEAGGFSLILGWQIYPWTHRELARRVNAELGLPVDSPRSLEQGTMARFMKWHRRRL